MAHRILVIDDLQAYNRHAEDGGWNRALGEGSVMFKKPTNDTGLFYGNAYWASPDNNSPAVKAYAEVYKHPRGAGMTKAACSRE